MLPINITYSTQLTSQSDNQSINQSMENYHKHAPLSSVPQPRCRSFSHELAPRHSYSRKLQNRNPVPCREKKNTKKHAVNTDCHHYQIIIKVTSAAAAAAAADNTHAPHAH